MTRRSSNISMWGTELVNNCCQCWPFNESIQKGEIYDEIIIERINRRRFGIEQRIRHNAPESHIVQISKSNDVIDSDTGRLFLHILWKYGCTEKSKNNSTEYSAQQY